MRRRPAIAALLLAALAAGPARADGGPVPLPVTLQVRHDELYAAFDIGRVFTPKVREKLTSGLTNRIRIIVRLRPLDRDLDELTAPISVSVRECDIAYDLWGERFGLVLDDAGHRTRRVFRDQGPVIRACARVRGVDLAPLGALDLRRRYRIEVKVEVNPVEAGDADATRADLGDPIGHRRSGQDSGGTLFGAVANFFTRDPPAAADGVTRFQSPVFGEAAIQAALARAAGRHAGTPAPSGGSPRGRRAGSPPARPSGSARAAAPHRPAAAPATVPSPPRPAR